MDRADPLENNYTPVSSVTSISSGHYPVPTLSSTITVIAPAHHGNNTTESWSEFHEEQLDHNSYGRPPLPKKRCRDYDGKSVFFSIASCNSDRPLSEKTFLFLISFSTFFFVTQFLNPNFISLFINLACRQLSLLAFLLVFQLPELFYIDEK